MIAVGLSIGLLERPGCALAQAGYYVTPAFSLSESYDDNVFLTRSNRQDDFVSPFPPALKAGYRSAPFTLFDGYSFRRAVYAEHPLLSTAVERRLGRLELAYRPA